MTIIFYGQTAAGGGKGCAGALYKEQEDRMKEENEMKKAFLERFWTSKKIQESI